MAEHSSDPNKTPHLHNGDSHQPSPNLLGDSTAMPKHLAGRKQSSSKKFKIESVAASDDPLYTLNAAGTSSAAAGPPLPYGQQRKISEAAEDPPSTSSASNRHINGKREPEGYGGDAEFQSLEDIRAGKQRTSSILSTNDQKFFSVEDVNKERPLSTEVYGTSVSQVELDQSQCNVDFDSSQDDFVEMRPGRDGVAKPGAIHYSRRPGDSRLKFDDSFYKKATVEMRLDSNNQPDPEAITNIFVPVPMSAPTTTTLPSIAASHEGNLHETITSAYETNLSINKLLRERHKGSLAAMGRLFGSKQREIEKKNPATSLGSTEAQKKKKGICQRIQAVHICLVLTFLIIIISTVVTLVMMQKNRENIVAISGYKFDYKTRILVVYPWTNASDLTPHDDVTIFKAELGVNLGIGVPFNCSHNSTEENEVGCYKWHSKSTLRLYTETFDTTGLCIGVEWDTWNFNPMLEDCIDLDYTYGHWYGGHMNSKHLHLGGEEVKFSAFLPGEQFGQVAERFWISTKGIAVVAAYDFPLHIRTDSNKLCLSSWYGHQPSTDVPRKLSYAICRADSFHMVHQLVMERFYKNIVSEPLDYNILFQPIYTSNGEDITEELIGRNYSYIIDSQTDVLLTNDTQSTADLPTNQTGYTVSPYVVALQSLSYLEDSLWIQSIDLNAPRLFNRKDTLYALLNSSSTLSDILQPMNSLIRVRDIGIADLKGQQYYPINQTLHTFQPYIQNFIRFIAEITTQPIMSSHVSALQKSPIIVDLPPITDIRVTVKNVLHSSMMGYNLINFGEISGSLSTADLIRRLQLAIFSPVVEYSQSVLSSLNSSEVTRSWESCEDARRQLKVVDIIKNHLERNDTSPLFTPVWWDNTESTAYNISDQFIFNNQYLVAPVYNTTSTIREVFLPKGVWVRINILKPDNKYITSVFTEDDTPAVIPFNVDLDEMLIFQYGNGKKGRDQVDL